MTPSSPPAAGSRRPVALDLCVGLGGWAEGLVAVGYHVIGVDIEDMFAALGEPKPDHFELVIADICKVNGADYAHVSLIVGSSPCQDFSYRAMPWKRAKALHAPFLGMWLFWQQFRIQREASTAAGWDIPLVVENVKGAQPWIGRARANFGSYYLWGNVPALMPMTAARKVSGFRFDGSGRSFQTAAVNEHLKNERGGSWFKIGSPGQVALNNNPDDRQWKRDPVASCGSGSPKRKAASAKIAKIPLALSTWIGRTWLPHPSPKE